MVELPEAAARASCPSRAAITSSLAAGAACRAAAYLLGTERFLGGGYGVELKRGCRKLYGAFVGFSVRGEMIPNKDSYCEIDNDVVDQWGIPVLKFHFKWSDDEILQARHGQETFRGDHSAAAGGEVTYSDGAGDPVGHFARAARSFTRWAPPAWATTANSVLEPLLPGLGLQEPVRHRRRALREQRRQEPDTHHHGLGLAHLRIRCGAGEETESVIVDCRLF